MEPELKDRPSRDKYWKELTDAEKLERSRIIIKNLETELYELKHTVNKLVRRFQIHNHFNGKIVIEDQTESYYEYDGPTKRNYRIGDTADEFYF